VTIASMAYTICAGLLLLLTTWLPAVLQP